MKKRRKNTELYNNLCVKLQNLSYSDILKAEKEEL